jgi:hypothetical protein
MKSYEKCVKLITYGPCVALIGSLLIGSPQGLAQTAESSPSEPLRLTVAPRTTSRIAMKTLPKAVCVLHVDGDTDTSHSFKLFSDDEGIIRFNVNPSEQSDEVADYAVGCTSEGQSGTFGLELRANTIPTSDMPAPTVEKRTPKASDVIRPALTKAEALELSDDEVVKREYPVRPNPKEALDEFAAWLQVVTQPARRVDPRQVADLEARASDWEISGGWSGFALENAPNEVPVSTYDLVQGEWTVPTVSQSHIEQNTTTYSYFWIGLDGDNNTCPEFCPVQGEYQYSDLWQAGTQQDVTNYHYGPWGIFSNTFSTYNVWSEFVPAQSVQVLPNFSVSPGDMMFSEVYVANAGGAPSLSGLFAIAFIEDMTKSEYTWVYNCRGLMIGGNCTAMDQIPILGYQAEWIMERPYIQGAISALADYNQAWMYYPSAQQTNGAYANYNGANSQDIWMYNSSTGDLLTVPYVWNNTTIQFIWYNFQ